VTAQCASGMPRRVSSCMASGEACEPRAVGFCLGSELGSSSLEPV
jgi:hypothetical protein